MSVNQFMLNNISAIQGIIDAMTRPFNSHDFIQKFSQAFQAEYVSFLTQYQDEPFEKVHQQIATFLGNNVAKLGIRKNGKVESINIFGETNLVEQWV